MVPISSMKVLFLLSAYAPTRKHAIGLSSTLNSSIPRTNLTCPGISQLTIILFHPITRLLSSHRTRLILMKPLLGILSSVCSLTAFSSILQLLRHRGLATLQILGLVVGILMRFWINCWGAWALVAVMEVLEVVVPRRIATYWFQGNPMIALPIPKSQEVGEDSSFLVVVSHLLEVELSISRHKL